MRMHKDTRHRSAELQFRFGKAREGRVIGEGCSASANGNPPKADVDVRAPMGGSL